MTVPTLTPPDLTAAGPTAPELTAPQPPAPLDWLVAAPAPAPEGVRLADVGRVGWQVLLRDGVLRPVWGDVAAAAGRPAGPALRAAAVRALVPPRAVLGRAGAVWVHAGGPAPSRFDVLVEPRVRRPSPDPARVPHECPLPPHDVVRLGEVRVTTVPRTALDLARWLRPDEAAPLLRRLVAQARLDTDEVLATAARSADRRLLPRLRAVLAAVTALDAQDREAGTPAALDPVMR